MASSVQINRIISEVNNLEEKDKVILFRKMEKLFDDFDAQQHEELSIESAFGLWKNRNITKETLRKKAWGKK